MIPDAFANSNTALRNLDKISGGTDLPSGSVTSEWLEQHVELGVREATKTLLDNGLMTVSSSANHENVGGNRTTRPYIAISMAKSNPQSKALFMARVEELNKATELRELSEGETGFHIFEDMNPNNAEAGQVVIKVDAFDTDTVGDVSNRFTDLVNFLTTKSERDSNDTNESSSEATEINLTESQQRIFAPLLHNEVENNEGADNSSGYDKYFNPGFDVASLKVADAAVNGQDTGREVTEQSDLEAQNALRAVNDFVVKSGIEDVARKAGVSIGDTKKIVELIRTNTELRYNLASGLLRKLEGLVDSGMLPERVGRKNEQKSPARLYGGLSQMSSRDYVVALALSMLDGTYNSNRADSEKLDVPLNKRRHGQHRGVARALLFDQY